jgi:hypothetical protein
MSLTVTCSRQNLPPDGSTGSCRIERPAMRHADRSFECGFIRHDVIPLSLALAAVIACQGLLISPAEAYRSSSGPRVAGFGVLSAPVDRLGPTMRSDPMMLPDSGFLGSGTAGNVGNGRSGLTPVFAPPAPPPVPVVAPAPSVVAPSTARPKKAKSRGRIILQKAQ